jgi:hypothetical protein
MLVSRGDLRIVIKRPTLGSCIVGLLVWSLGSCGGGSTASRAGGSGGSTGAAGTGGGTGGAVVDAATSDAPTDSGPFARVLASFDPYADASPGLEGFALGAEDDPGNVGGGVGASLAWTGADGSPAGGALVCAAPFDGADELVDVQKSYGAAFPQDWRGKGTLTSWIKVASTPASASGLAFSIQLYAQSFSGTADGGASSTCPPDPAKCYLPASHPTDGGVAVYETCSSVTPVAAIGAWVQYRLDLSSCGAAFTLDTIVAFGVIIQSSAANGDAGALDGSAVEVALDMPAPDGGDVDAATDVDPDALDADGNDEGAPSTSTVILLDTFALE